MVIKVLQYIMYSTTMFYKAYVVVGAVESGNGGGGEGRGRRPN